MATAAVDRPIPGVPRDAILLIHGPPLTGKYELMLHLIAQHVDRAIVISTRNQASRIISDYRAITGAGAGERLGIVDCTSQIESVSDLHETKWVKYASSPENLTQIGVKFTELFDTFSDHPGGAQVGVGFHSLSQLVMHTDVESVYQFLQVLTGQLRSIGWFGLAVLDETPDNGARTDTLRHHFDGLVETRENDAGYRQYRVRHPPDAASEWTSF